MSYSPEQLLKIAHNFDQLAVQSLIVEAKEKKKKLDPKAKVRNRGTVCVPAASAKDKKDHFPINDEGQARNALARVQQFKSVPEWYKGSLEGLKKMVSSKVHSKYPGIKSEKKKKSSVSVDRLINKYGQGQAPNYDAGQPATYNPAEQTGADAYRFMKPTYDSNTATPPGMKWVVENDERKLVPNTPAPAATPQAGGWTGETIDPVFQTMLGVNADGKLGRQTQYALNRYKAGRNPNMTNALAYEYLKKEPEYASKAAMKYDDNSNTYAKPAAPATPVRASLEVLMKRYG
jgi:hypothetical protein